MRTPSTANTVYIGCGGPNPFHDWYLLYADNPIWTITGTIYKSTELNNGGNFWDGDWSIYIHPADDFALRNPGAGKTNGDPWIEAEVMTHSWPIARSMLREAFTTGTKVYATGYLVGDDGHDDKTELHPLRYILSDPWTNNPFWIFVAQDHSGRFIVANQDLWENIWFFEATGTGGAMESSPDHHSPSNARILTEESAVSEGAAPVAFLARPMSIPGNPTSLVVAGLDMHLRPGVFFTANESGCDTDGTMWATQWSPIAAYLGKFTSSYESLALDDTISYSASTDAAGRKSLSVRITLNLQDSPNRSWAYSHWWLPGDPAPTVGRRVTRVYRYAPWAGDINNSWNVTLFALSRDRDWSPPADALAQRIWATETRHFYLPTTWVDVSLKGVGDSCSATRRASLTVKPTPFTQVTGVTWRVQRYKDIGGNAVTNATFQDVTPAAPIDNTDFRASIDGAHDPLALSVTLKSSAAQVRVEGTASTDIGEKRTQRDIALVPNGCGFRPQVVDAIARIRDQMRREALIGEGFDTLFRRLPPQDTSWMRAYLTVRRGGRITTQQERLLVTHARSLPAPTARPHIILRRPVEARLPRSFQVPFPSDSVRVRPLPP